MNGLDCKVWNHLQNNLVELDCKTSNCFIVVIMFFFYTIKGLLHRSAEDQSRGCDRISTVSLMESTFV